MARAAVKFLFFSFSFSCVSASPVEDLAHQIVTNAVKDAFPNLEDASLISDINEYVDKAAAEDLRRNPEHRVKSRARRQAVSLLSLAMNDGSHRSFLAKSQKIIAGDINPVSQERKTSQTVSESDHGGSNAKEFKKPGQSLNLLEQSKSGTDSSSEFHPGGDALAADVIHQKQEDEAKISQIDEQISELERERQNVAADLQKRDSELNYLKTVQNGGKVETVGD